MLRLSHTDITKKLIDAAATSSLLPKVEIIKDPNPSEVVVFTIKKKGSGRLSFGKRPKHYTFEYETKGMKIQLSYSLSQEAAIYFMYPREVEIFIQNQVKDILPSSGELLRSKLEAALKMKKVSLNNGITVTPVGEHVSSMTLGA